MSGTLDLSGYKLTFDDEFNSFNWNSSGTPGNGTWQTNFYFGGRSLPSNGEQETYSDASTGTNPFSIVPTGTAGSTALDIQAKPAASGGYTSGLITTEPSFTQTYGYFEMKAELPQGSGLWPAFWLLPADKSWPPEIDTLEAFGAPNAHGEGGANQYHVGAISGDSSQNNGGWQAVSPDIFNSYNTYGVKWDPQHITYYFDGQEVAQVNTPTDADKPMYMLANLAVGGNWPGDPNASTPFPADMKIDWIRAYSNDPNAQATAAQAGFNGPDGSASATASLTSSTAFAASDGSSTLPVSAMPAAAATPDETRVSVAPDSTGTATGGGQPSDLTATGPGQTLIGNSGDDVFHIGQNADATIIENSRGSSEVVADVSDYTLPKGIANLVGTGPADYTFTGNGENNVIVGNTGNDVLDSGGGTAILTGGGGSNTFIMRTGYVQTTITDFDPAHDVVQLDGYGITDVSQLGSALTQNGSDTVLTLPDGGAVVFQNTAMSALTSADFTLGTTASPTPTPQETHAEVTPDATGTATGGTTPSELTATADGQTLNGKGGDDIFNIGSFAHTTVVENGHGVSEVDTSAASYTLPTGISNLLATDNGAHTLTGNGENNVITGGTGNDVIDSGGGTAILTGGGGSDTFVMHKGYVQDTITDFNPATDVVDLNGYGISDINTIGSGLSQHGTDTWLVLPDGGKVVFDNMVDSTLMPADFALDASTGSSGDGPVIPEPAAQPAAQIARDFVTPDDSGTATGTSNPSILLATGPGQTLAGHGGDDIFLIGDHADAAVTESAPGTSTVITSAQAYTLPTGIANLTGTSQGSQILTGNAGDNYITAGNGNNVISGGGGNDSFRVGTGANILTGGTGHDLFVFSNAADHGNVVTNFTAGQDELDLTGLLKSAHYQGQDPMANHVLQLVQSGNDTNVVIDPQGNGGSGAHTVVTLENVLPSSLKAGHDFIWHA